MVNELHFKFILVKTFFARERAGRRAHGGAVAGHALERGAWRLARSRLRAHRLHRDVDVARCSNGQLLRAIDEPHPSGRP